MNWAEVTWTSRPNYTVTPSVYWSPHAQSSAFICHDSRPPYWSTAGTVANRSLSSERVFQRLVHTWVFSRTAVQFSFFHVLWTRIYSLAIRYDTTCYFNVRPKADTSSFIYRVEQTTKKWNTEKVESKKTGMLRSIGKQSGESVSSVLKKTRSSAIAEGPRDASCQLKSCQLPRNSAETTYSTSPDQIDGMKLEI